MMCLININGYTAMHAVMSMWRQGNARGVCQPSRTKDKHVKETYASERIYLMPGSQPDARILPINDELFSASDRGALTFVVLEEVTPIAFIDLD